MSPFTEEFGSFRGPFKPKKEMEYSSDNYFRVNVGDLFFLTWDDRTESPAFIRANKAHLDFNQRGEFPHDWCYISIYHIDPVRINTQDEYEHFCMMYPNLTNLLTKSFQGAV